MNNPIKRAVGRWIQPMVEVYALNAIDHKLHYMEEEIEKMAESNIEAAIESARIDRMVEDEVENKIYEYDFEGDIKSAVENYDFEDSVMAYLQESDAVSEFIATQVRETVKDVIVQMEFVTEAGVVLKLRMKEQENEQE